MDNLKILDDLQNWYLAQCNGEWEHVFGVEIGTLDNPGWTLTIDLNQTELEDKPFAEVKDLEPEFDWFICKVENKKFIGAGGPQQLIKLLATFLQWAKK